MKKYRTILYAGLLLLSLVSCTSEEALKPSGVDKNYFAPEENATDEESVLRRDFYKKNNCYVLFNDTLRHEAIGADANGVMQYMTELVDVPYVMTSITGTVNKYQYLQTMADKRNAISFIENYLLSHLSNKLRPFCWLLVNQIDRYDIFNGDLQYAEELQYAVGNRATSVALGKISTMTDEDKTAFSQTILLGIMANKISLQTSSTLAPFTKYSSSLYNGHTTDPVSTEEENILAMNKAGFVTQHYWAGEYLILIAYPDQAEDVSSFVKLVLSKSESEVNELYADYPIILQKYAAMKSIIKQMGYIF